MHCTKELPHTPSNNHHHIYAQHTLPPIAHVISQHTTHSTREREEFERKPRNSLLSFPDFYTHTTALLQHTIGAPLISVKNSAVRLRDKIGRRALELTSSCIGVCVYAPEERPRDCGNRRARFIYGKSDSISVRKRGWAAPMSWADGIREELYAR